MVVASQQLFGLCILCLYGLQCLVDLVQAELVILNPGVSRCVLACSIVLDFLARIFDFGKANRGRGPFEKVSERAKLIKVAFSTVIRRVSASAIIIRPMP